MHIYNLTKSLFPRFTNAQTSVCTMYIVQSVTIQKDKNQDQNWSQFTLTTETKHHTNPRIEPKLDHALAPKCPCAPLCEYDVTHSGFLPLHLLSLVHVTVLYPTWTGCPDLGVTNTGAEGGDIIMSGNKMAAILPKDLGNWKCIVHCSAGSQLSR